MNGPRSIAPRRITKSGNHGRPHSAPANLIRNYSTIYDPHHPNHPHEIMKSHRENPDSEEMQKADKEHERYVGGLKLKSQLEGPGSYAGIIQLVESCFKDAMRLLKAKKFADAYNKIDHAQEIVMEIIRGEQGPQT